MKSLFFPLKTVNIFSISGLTKKKNVLDIHMKWMDHWSFTYFDFIFFFDSETSKYYFKVLE